MTPDAAATRALALVPVDRALVRDARLGRGWVAGLDPLAFTHDVAEARQFGFDRDVVWDDREAVRAVYGFADSDPIDPYRGLSPLRAAMLDVESSVFASEWQREFFQNSAMPGGVVTTDQV